MNGNEALVDQFFTDVLNRQNPGAAAQLLSQNFVAHHPTFGDLDAVGLGKMAAQLYAAFPDLSYVIKDHVSDNDKVATRWVAGGTHQGTFFGVPATNKSVSVPGTDIFRVDNGRLAEAWMCSDFFGLFLQLGSFPPPPAGGKFI